MKKILSILILPLFLIATVGLAVNKHYCGGKLKDIGLTVLDSKSCCGVEEMPEGCCHDDKEYLLLEAEFQSAPAYTLHHIPFVTVAVITAYLKYFHHTTLHTREYSQYQPPEPIRNIPVLIQSFLI